MKIKSEVGTVNMLKISSISFTDSSKAAPAFVYRLFNLYFMFFNAVFRYKC